MITVINSVALSGIDGIMVSVESGASSSNKPRLDIIGLPDAAVKEASGRVYSAARSSCINLKKGVLTVNIAALAPTAAVVLVAISCVLTVLAGFIPSAFASKVEPVKALRSE